MAVIAQPEMHWPVTRTAMPRSLNIWAITMATSMLPPGEAISTGSRVSTALTSMSASTGPESDTALALEAKARAHAIVLSSLVMVDARWLVRSVLLGGVPGRFGHIPRCVRRRQERADLDDVARLQGKIDGSLVAVGGRALRPDDDQGRWSIPLRREPLDLAGACHAGPLRRRQRDGELQERAVGFA